MTTPKKSAQKTITIAVDRIEPNPWNPNKQSDFMFEKERESIREFGFIDPCTVREHPKKKGWYQMIDGEHRWKGAVAEGYDEIECISLGTLSDAKAKALTDILNNLRGEQDPALRGALIKQILEDDESLRRLLPYGDDELQAILEQADFDWKQLSEDGDKGGEEGDSGDGESGWVGLKVSLTPQQHTVVSAAIASAKKKLNTDSEAEAVTAICKVFPKK
jgi:hypothetical protein